MRRFAALQTCFGLLTAFVLAPFQHVHTGHGPGADHAHAGLIHAHFYSLPAPLPQHTGRQFDDNDDDHRAVWSVNTFTLVIPAGLPPFLPSRVAVLPFVPSPAFEPVTVVEERGHDPPAADQLVPRAPPT
jgi:hypothetical protein